MSAAALHNSERCRRRWRKRDDRRTFRLLVESQAGVETDPRSRTRSSQVEAAAAGGRGVGTDTRRRGEEANGGGEEEVRTSSESSVSPPGFLSLLRQHLPNKAEERGRAAVAPGCQAALGCRPCVPGFLLGLRLPVVSLVLVGLRVAAPDAWVWVVVWTNRAGDSAADWAPSSACSSAALT